MILQFLQQKGSQSDAFLNKPVVYYTAHGRRQRITCQSIVTGQNRQIVHKT